ncbi:TetR/AcrR family transcriptional regulator [Brachybacterium alimentarium]|nr:TetR/AcrR family transcriptional regulator [Brachybacterium alimentarium]
MLDAAEAHLGADGTLTLDSAARAAGVTKPGLMYHFSTKEELLAAVLDRIAERYEQGMLDCVADRLGGDVEHFDAVAVRDRYLAYLHWAACAPLSPADLVIFADPHLRVPLTRRWQEQIDRWLEVPAGFREEHLSRLLAVRLLADGLWFDRASGLLEVSRDPGPLRELALDLLAGVP